MAISQIFKAQEPFCTLCAWLLQIDIEGVRLEDILSTTQKFITADHKAAAQSMQPLAALLAGMKMMPVISRFYPPSNWTRLERALPGKTATMEMYVFVWDII